MTVYLVKEEGDKDKGQFYSTKAEAEAKAAGLSEIPNGKKYTVKPIEI